MDEQLKAIIDRAIADGASDEDIDLLVQEHQKRATPPETPEQRRQRIIDDADFGPMGIWGSRENVEDPFKRVREHPMQTAAMLAIPGVLGAAAKYGPPIVRSGVQALTSPAGAATIGGLSGAYSGAKYGGVPGAVVGGMTGAATGYAGARNPNVQDVLRRLGLSKPSAVAQGMSQAAAQPTSYTRPATMDALLNGASADELAAIVSAKQAAPQAAAPARPAMTPQQQLAQEIDWRTVDAVPINAMQRKGILEAGESRVGLSERAAQAAKAGDTAEVERLLKALRQRMHISGN